MKTYYKLLACLLLIGFSMLNLTTANAQCTNASSFASAVAPTGAGVTTITTCSFQAEYSTITSVIAGNSYVVTGSIPGTYITMRFSTPAGAVVAAGVTPLQFTAPCSGTYYAHWNTNSACGTAFSCMTTTIACSSCGAAASQCTNASSFASAVAPVAGVTTITTCSFAAEYSTITGVAATTVYSSTASGAGSFITVHSGSPAGPVVASGETPLIWTSTSAGTYYLHWNTNSACGTAFSCMTTTIGFVGGSPCAPPPSGCTFASSFGSATLPGSNALTTISTCSFAGEYSTIFGAVAGTTLQFTFAPAGFITIHSGSPAGPIIASGASPLSFANTFTGTLYAHWALNSSCATDFSCHTTTVQCTSCPSPGAINDFCAGATVIACGGSISSTTVGNNPDANACGGATTPGVWYSLTPAASGSVTLSLCTGTPYDSRLSVYSGGCASPVLEGCNDDFCGAASQLTFAAVGGTNYRILVNGFSGADQGAFTLTVTCAGAFDPCTSISPISACNVPVTTTIASGTGAYTNGPFAPPGQEKIYTFTPTVTGNYFISQSANTTGTWVDYFFKAQSGGCNSTGWTFVQDLLPAVITSSTPMAMTAGVPYYVYIDPENTAGGTVTFQINCSVVAPVNDLCTAVSPLPLAPGSPLTFTGTTVGATSAGDGSFTAFPTVWHSFTLAACADVTLNYCATSPAFGDVWINLGTACPAFSFVNATSFSQSCPGGGSNWIIQYNGLAAGTYWIPVLGAEAGFVVPGPYSLTATAVACPPPPANDLCSTATPVSCGDLVTGNTTTATDDIIPACTFSTGNNFHGVWYALTLPTSGTITLSTCTYATWDTYVRIFSGSCGSLTCVGSNDDFCGLQSTLTTAPVPAGTYYILLSGFGSGSFGAFSMQISCALCVTPPSGGTISGAATGCTGNASSYSTAGSTGTLQWQVSTTSATGPWTDISGATSPSLSYVPVSAGTYYFQVIASGPGCVPSPSTNVWSTSVSPSGGILTTSATPSSTACPGTSIDLTGLFSTGASTLTITISAPGFEDEVEWTCGSFSGGPYAFGSTNVVTISPSSYPVIFSINSVGSFNDNTPTYSVFCNATSTMLVTGSLAGGQTFTSGPLNCAGSPGVLTSPSWSGPNGFSANTLVASLPVTSTSAGVYTLTGTTPTGCQVSSSVTVNVNPSPVPNASSSGPVCDGTGLSLFGDNLASGQTSGNSYTWTGPNGYSASGQYPTIGAVSLLSSGNYTVTVTNSFGCTESATTNVVINTNPILNAASVTNATCIGATDGCIDIDATNGAPVYLYDYLGNTTLDGIYCGLGAGTYTVTVVDDNGCEGSLNTTVIEEDLVPPSITCITNVTVNNTPTLCSGVATWIGPVGTDNCAGSITTQTGGPASGSTFPVGTTPITYTVTDVFLNTATCSFNVIVVDNENPSITCPADVFVNNDPGLCGAASSNVALGFPTTGDNCSIFGTTNNGPTFYPVGATIVDWETQDLAGNKASCQQFVIVVDNEFPTISGMPANITITADPTDCNPSISWTAPSAADNCSIASFTSTSNPGDNFPEGTTTVTYTAIDINGNQTQASFTVTILTQPLVVVSTPTVYACGYNITCNGSSNGQILTNVTGGCLPYTYSWSNGSTNANISGVAAGTYVVNIIDGNGHTTSQSTTLTQPPALNTTLGPDQSYEFSCSCTNLVSATSGGSTCLPYSYAWSTGATSANIAVCPNQTTNYTITVTDANGCTKTDVISVIKPALVGQLDRYVLMGTGSGNVQVGNNCNFTNGSVGKRLAAGNLQLGNNGFYNLWVAGNNVTVGNNCTISTLYRNTASVGNGAIISSTITPVAIPLTVKVPCFPVFSGGTNVNVANGATVTISPGTYNNITLGNNSILRLNAGIYNVNSVNTGNGSSILPNGVATAKDLILFVKTTISTGNNNTIHGTYYAQGQVQFGNGNNTTGVYRGAFFGNQVQTGNNLSFYLDSYCYSNLALCNVKIEGDETSVDAEQGTFKLFPNPNNGMFTVQYDGQTGNNISISVLNTLGQSVYERNVYEFTGEITQDIDLSNLNAGIYFIQVRNGSELSNKQFIITK